MTRSTLRLTQLTFFTLWALVNAPGFADEPTPPVPPPDATSTDKPKTLAEFTDVDALSKYLLEQKDIPDNVRDAIEKRIGELGGTVPDKRTTDARRPTDPRPQPAPLNHGQPNGGQNQNGNQGQNQQQQQQQNQNQQQQQQQQQAQASPSPQAQQQASSGGGGGSGGGMGGGGSGGKGSESGGGGLQLTPSKLALAPPPASTGGSTSGGKEETATSSTTTVKAKAPSFTAPTPGRVAPDVVAALLQLRPASRGVGSPTISGGGAGASSMAFGSGGSAQRAIAARGRSTTPRGMTSAPKRPLGISSESGTTAAISGDVPAETRAFNDYGSGHRGE